MALLVGGLSVTIALAFGLLLGVAAGFNGGWLDALLMRGVEILLAFPYLLLAIAIVAALGPGALNTTLAVGIWGVPAVTRIVRGSVLALRETEYVGAACALGAPAPAVLRRHILPNVLPGLIVYATLFMANAILLEAALSFLGLGVQPPTASWGVHRPRRVARRAARRDCAGRRDHARGAGVQPRRRRAARRAGSAPRRGRIVCPHQPMSRNTPRTMSTAPTTTRQPSFSTALGKR